ncbi:MAG: EVE domain-containing protein [Pseudobacteriovorax sp.]|nr:EVE domain-containing protein [Pseudobacteriovorax sp.]
MAKQYWLMKTEEDVFSFDDLINCPDHTDSWDGIRNYQARNFMRDEFSLGDKVFIYHSNTKDIGIYGVAEVVKEAYPDHTALDPKAKYFDAKSAEKGVSRWMMVDVKATHRMTKPILLSDLKTMPELDGLALLQRGQRLSIQKVSSEHWKIIYQLGKAKKI